MIRGELPSRPDNRLPARVEPAGGWEVVVLVAYDPPPPVETMYLTEHVSSVRVLLPDGRTETITELRQ